MGVDLDRRALLTAAALAGVIATVAGTASVADAGRSSSTKPLVFGIYPGGAAGTVGPSGPVAPENPAKRLAALLRLRHAGQPFVVRLYAAYTGPNGQSVAQQIGGELAGYTRAHLDVELALTYRPQTGGTRADVSHFADFVRATVRSLGGNPRFVSLQVTNEANVGGAPNVADGYYAAVRDALIAGVLAAKQEVRRARFTQLKVGFNWAYVTARSDRNFWSYLGSHGGGAFRAAVDWVGLDIYPGTWGPSMRGKSLAAGTTRFIDEALAQLHRNLLAAGIPSTVPLHVSESGYPTGPGRTDAMQVESMKATIAAFARARNAYPITGYTWFDLRDANSGGGNFQTQYGLMRDDYSPKPAFAVYRSLIARLSKR